ncbi:NTP transferase domain-containing protein [candidate division KSB1 bacterium]|nr:NTP transferase domain-containing protein [candidate division KSB1 bacterium]
MHQPLNNIAAVVLAAGKSTRMKSKLNKLLVMFEDKPLVHHVRDACLQAGIQQIIMVIGPEMQAVKSSLGDSIQYAVQHERLGTGHALMQARPLLKNFKGDLVVLVGDHPFITDESILCLLKHHRASHAAATLLTAMYEQPPAQGRIVRDSTGKVIKIVEEKDATPEEIRIKEVNISTYCFDAQVVLPLLDELGADNVQKEYYLTDIVAILLRHHYRVEAIPYEDNKIGVGINSRLDLATALKIMRDDYLKKLMLSGVTVIDPASTFVDSTVSIGADTIIYPYTYIEKGTTIGPDCVIGPQAKLSASQIGKGAKIQFAVIDNCEIKDGARVGPFEYIKDGMPVLNRNQIS